MRVVVGREAVRDEALVGELIVEELQLQAARAERPIEVEIGGRGVGVGEVAIADEHRAAVERGRSHPAVEHEAAVRRGWEAEIALDQSAGPDLVRGQPPIMVGVDEGGVAAGGVGPVVDQGLGQAVPAGRLHIAVGAIDHAARGQTPVLAEIQVRGDLGELMVGVDAVIIAAAVLSLGIGVHPACGPAQAKRRAQLSREAREPVAADGRLHLAGGFGQEALFDAGGARDEVQGAAHLARPIEGARRAADDLHPFGGGKRGGVGAAVLHPLETAEVVFGQGPPQRERAGHAVIAVGEGAGRDGDQVVDGAHAVAVQGGAGGEARRPRSLEQGDGETEDRVAGAPLQQAGGVARGHRQGLHGGGLGRGGARNDEGGEQSCGPQMFGASFHRGSA